MYQVLSRTTCVLSIPPTSRQFWIDHLGDSLVLGMIWAQTRPVSEYATMPARQLLQIIYYTVTKLVYFVFGFFFSEASCLSTHFSQPA